MRYLDLRCRQVTAAGLVQLSCLTRLESLNVATSHALGPMPGLPGLKSLQVSGLP
jgi:hypothetical protein